MNKRAGEDRAKVNAEVHYRIEYIAYREKLDLDKPAAHSATAAAGTDSPDIAPYFAASSKYIKTHHPENYKRAGQLGYRSWEHEERKRVVIGLPPHLQPRLTAA